MSDQATQPAEPSLGVEMDDGRFVSLPLRVWLDQDLVRAIWEAADAPTGTRCTDVAWAELVASLLDRANPAARIEVLDLDPEGDL